MSTPCSWCRRRKARRRALDRRYAQAHEQYDREHPRPDWFRP